MLCGLNNDSFNFMDPTGSGSQTCGVTVASGTETSTATESYTYDETLTPMITDVSPKRSGTGGGTRVTITGEHFG